MKLVEKINCSNCGAENLSNARFCSRCGHELPQVKVEPAETQVTQPAYRSTQKRDIILGTVLGLAIFSSLVYFYLHVVPTILSPSFGNLAMMTANELNKKCPLMVDQDTRLDNVHVLTEKSFQYNYTLLNLDKTAFDADAAKKYVEAELLNKVKTNPDMQIYRDNKITLIYNYRDKNGVLLWEFTMTPEMYQ